MLPHGELVTVELPPAEPGRYEFTCAMNAVHGTLVGAPRRPVRAPTLSRPGEARPERKVQLGEAEREHRRLMRKGGGAR